MNMNALESYKKATESLLLAVLAWENTLNDEKLPKVLAAKRQVALNKIRVICFDVTAYITDNNLLED